MSTLFFTSDTHFDHEKVIGFNDRPFGSVDEMNETLVENWNFTVGKNDWVYHLGDVSFRSHPKEWLRQLNGNIVVICGNHDSEKQLQQCVDEGVIRAWEHVKYKRWSGDRFFLSHYAHRVWRNSHHGSFHLYGHSHGDLEGMEWGRSMDVGVDACEYVPVHVNWVINQLSQRDIVNHHIPKR